MMKKLTKLGIEELRKILPEFPKDEQRLLYGGHDSGDCWWRCMAYIKSNGTSFSADDAMSLAYQYHQDTNPGTSFDPNEYTFRAKAPRGYQDYIDNYVSCPDCGSHMQTRVLTYDPLSGNVDEWHSVIVIEMGPDYFDVIDPQQGGLQYRIYLDEIEMNSQGRRNYFLNIVK